MKVGEICNREVVIAHRDDSLLAAGKLMRTYHVGSLIVVEEDDGRRHPVGVVTDRDILIEVLVEGISLEKVAVGDIMNTQLITVDQDDDLYDIIKTMRRKGIRRIPVVDKWNHLVGIVTMDDILEFITEEIQDLSSIFNKEKKIEEEMRP